MHATYNAYDTIVGLTWFMQSTAYDVFRWCDPVRVLKIRFLWWRLDSILSWCFCHWRLNLIKSPNLWPFVHASHGVAALLTFSHGFHHSRHLKCSSLPSLPVSLPVSLLAGLINPSLLWEWTTLWGISLLAVAPSLWALFWSRWRWGHSFHLHLLHVLNVGPLTCFLRCAFNESDTQSVTFAFHSLLPPWFWWGFLFTCWSCLLV